MLDEVTILWRRLGHSTQKHTHTHPIWMCLAHTQTCMCCVHTHMHTHTRRHIPLHCRNWRKRKKGSGGGVQLTSGPANHAAADFRSVSIRANQRLWWAHTSSIARPWFAAVVWHGDGSSLCSSHGSWCHSHRSRQAVGQPARFGSCWLGENIFFCCPGALASTKHPLHHQLFTTSAVCSCIWLCECVSACTCHCVSQCVWSRHALVGSLESLIPATPLGFLGRGLLSCGYLQKRNTMLHFWTTALLLLIYTEPSSESSSGWGVSIEQSCGLFLFLLADQGFCHLNCIF